jgi:choice-of-anchor A domain-containing protein
MNITHARTGHGHKSQLNVEPLEGREVPASGLGIATDFSAFVLHNTNAFSSQIEGRAAVGGNAAFTNYGIGSALTNSHGTRDDLIVGGNLNFTNGQVFNGNVAYGGTGTFTSFGHPNGDIRRDSVIDFAAAETSLRALSDQYAAMPANGTVRFSYGTLTLTGANSTRNVFRVTASQLWYANNLIVRVPAGSSAIINVSGTNNRMQYMGMSVQGTTRDRVLLNFYQATQLKLNGVGVEASVLAPRAFVDFSNGQISGNLVASSWTGFGQVRYQPPEITPSFGTSKLVGMVYRDENSDGNAQDWEWRFEGVHVALSGTDIFGNPVARSTTTDVGGIYRFANLVAGTYTINVTAPDGYLPGTGDVGAFGGTPGLNTVTGISVPVNQVSGGYNFGQLVPPAPPVAESRLVGMVYRDENADGDPQDWEWRFEGVSVSLTGTDLYGNPVARTTTTNAGGIYRFADLVAGIYSIVVTPPAGYAPGMGDVGAFGGTAGLNTVTGITVPESQISGGYNFGQLAI